MIFCHSTIYILFCYSVYNILFSIEMAFGLWTFGTFSICILVYILLIAYCSIQPLAAILNKPIIIIIIIIFRMYTFFAKWQSARKRMILICAMTDVVELRPKKWTCYNPHLLILVPPITGRLAAHIRQPLLSLLIYNLYSVWNMCLGMLFLIVVLHLWPYLTLSYLTFRVDAACRRHPALRPPGGPIVLPR